VVSAIDRFVRRPHPIARLVSQAELLLVREDGRLTAILPNEKRIVFEYDVVTGERTSAAERALEAALRYSRMHYALYPTTRLPSWRPTLVDSDRMWRGVAESLGVLASSSELPAPRVAARGALPASSAPIHRPWRLR
jgi:hypothetical protein